MGKILFEHAYVFVVCTAPAVYRLIVVADNRNVFIGNQAHKAILLKGRVLKLIDHNVFIPLPVAFEHVGMFFKQFYRQHD